MIGLSRQYAAALARTARWRLLYVLALMVAASLTEGLGLALMLPVLQIAGVEIGAHSEAGRFAALVRGALNAVGLHPTLSLMLALFVAVIGARAMLTLAQGVAITALDEDFARHLRQRLFEAVSAADWMFIC